MEITLVIAGIVLLIAASFVLAALLHRGGRARPRRRGTTARYSADASGTFATAGGQDACATGHAGDGGCGAGGGGGGGGD